MKNMITYNVCFDSYQLEPYSGKWYKCNFNKEFISEKDIKNIINDYMKNFNSSEIKLIKPKYYIKTTTEKILF